MPRWWKLDYNDGDFVIVRSPSLAHSALVRQYHIQLNTALEGIPVYPIDEGSETQIYNHYRIYYQKIADLLEPEPVDCDRLMPLSRHEFFVCTEPVKHPKREQLLPGLSHLSTLMGYSYSEKESEPPEFTTGDYELDLYVDALLVFKGGARKLVSGFSPEDVSKMIIQANHRTQQATEAEESKNKTAAPVDTEPLDSQDNEAFLEQKDKISQGLQDLNVELPQGW